MGQVNKRDSCKKIMSITEQNMLHNRVHSEYFSTSYKREYLLTLSRKSSTNVKALSETLDSNLSGLVKEKYPYAQTKQDLDIRTTGFGRFDRRYEFEIGTIKASYRYTDSGTNDKSLEVMLTFMGKELCPENAAIKKEIFSLYESNNLRKN